MNRRSFIASLLATAALDPEKLLWVPGAKKIFVPPVGNRLIDHDWLIAETMVLLNKSLSLAKYAHYYLSMNDDIPIGTTIKIVRPKWIAENSLLCS